MRTAPEAFDKTDRRRWWRLADKFTVGDGCWEWTASKQISGYGQVRIRGQLQRAHRAVYELFNGRLEDGLQLHHTCMNRGCVRPDHLVPLTLEAHAAEHR